MMKKFNPIIYMLLVGILGFPSRFCIAQEESEKEKVKTYESEEVVITATKSERNVKDLSATVSIINREDIEVSNSKSCTEILNTLPGLFVHKTGSFGRADVDIRGVGDRGRSVMVVIDGRPVKMGLFGCTVTHSLPLNNVERIEVVRGPLSVLYGSDALGGVINIITRKPTEKYETNITASYGTYNTQQYQLLHGGNLGNFNYYFTADKRLSDGHISNSAYDGRDFTAMAGYKINKNLEVTLSSKYFDGHKEEPLRATDPYFPPSETWNDYKRGAVDFNLKGKYARGEGFMKIYRNFGEHKFSDGYHSKDFTNGALVHASGRYFTDNELTLGTEFRQQGGELINSGEWDKYEYAFFFHDEQVLLQKFILTFGGRYNKDEISGSIFCPQAGMVCHLNEKTVLRGSVNKGFRSPQLNELYMFPPSNKDLKPEVVWSYEAGVNHQIVQGVNIDVAGYIMKGENLIQTEKNLNPPPMFKFQNTGEFEFKGVETSLSAKIGTQFSSRISYTYLDPGDKTMGRPGDKIDFMMRYAEERFSVSISGQYVADYFAANNSKERIDNYLIANTRLSYNPTPYVEVFLAIDNILDKEYAIYASLPGGAAGIYSMPRRTFESGLRFKF